ncbi:hypothetical protein [Luteimonas deserti]|uniref:Beta-barrel assembly machine subunit BamC n=1 Tax=Luteimonas deserti TaxID=2752306 RepID=A0A7Z0TZC1_9GAMM|nr:hypothetical protein [Luteimonas deserti]NYZ63800.1 hypothetical protein [Luteimonas deserti]
MRPIPFFYRPLGIAVLAVVVAGASGCSWLKRDNALYAQSPESRPLEVPPDLDLPRTDGAMALPPGTGSVTRSGTVPAVTAPSNVAFTVPGERDAVFARVGEALAGIEGAGVTSRSQALGTYEVSYAGTQVLVRVASGQGGTVVSAVDPRGMAATGEAVERLIATLRSALAG